MDAPPDKENIIPFIEVDQLLAKTGILVPEIIAINKEQGFLVLSDLGDELLLKSFRRR